MITSAVGTAERPRECTEENGDQLPPNGNLRETDIKRRVCKEGQHERSAERLRKKVKKATCQGNKRAGVSVRTGSAVLNSSQESSREGLGDLGDRRFSDLVGEILAEFICK